MLKYDQETKREEEGVSGGGRGILPFPPHPKFSEPSVNGSIQLTNSSDFSDH